jgi:hypothetical protein
MIAACHDQPVLHREQAIGLVPDGTRIVPGIGRNRQQFGAEKA